MYTRSYAEEKSGILIPESYGGIAFSESNISARQVGEERHTSTQQESDITDQKNEREASTEEAFNPITKIKTPSFLSNIFSFNNFSLQKIGKEEILILAAAAFLFFSKEGDRELAIMLLLLLFLG